jgi:hypothetical protein
VVPEKHFQWEPTGCRSPLISPVSYDPDSPTGVPTVIQAGAALQIIHNPLDTLRCTIETCKLNERWDSAKYPEMRACYLSSQSAITMDECDDTFRMVNFVASPRFDFSPRRLGREGVPRLAYTGWCFFVGRNRTWGISRIWVGGLVGWGLGRMLMRMWRTLLMGRGRRDIGCVWLMFNVCLF